MLCIHLVVKVSPDSHMVAVTIGGASGQMLVYGHGIVTMHPGRGARGANSGIPIVSSTATVTLPTLQGTSDHATI